jgi:hypothetical protein
MEYVLKVLKVALKKLFTSREVRNISKVKFL